MQPVLKPRLLFRPDAVLGWRLTPDHSVQVGFRENVIQHIDRDGWRRVPNATPAKGPRVGIYGCSFTYGTGLTDEETFAARLQDARPQVRILNRGIGGHGTTQNLLQLRRDIAQGAVDAAVFAIISDHRFRNIAHPQRMRQYLSPDWYHLGVEQVPVARLDADGRARIVYHPIWQPVIRDADFHIFLPDDFMINSATLAVLDLVRETTAEAAVPLGFVLLDALDPDFSAAVRDRFPETHDISTPYDRDHTFLPRDIHPNARANALFAERLDPVVTGLCASLPGGDAP
ncbi:SGNH/GDSL hydrolase family protein [Roseisalinus antarcticus]|uniref:SGNH hydrolase-type esterase domain-containing protein n=1 Tax=Roseisalinus antarcticus TaxID=254357 RepID=A0A1Y5U1L9_9RHOB|nr:SGNH/GDSL hydrolase family protein [Roseisalinus antarcticus]SLN76845.1 hypothetical protein ROA7023_04253 [Roseisalinus antarcticus]